MDRLKYSLVAAAFLASVTVEAAERQPDGLQTIELASKICGGGETLLRKGAIAFCAVEPRRWPATATYSIEGNAVRRVGAHYAADIDAVLETAQCLTGTRFVRAEKGNLRIVLSDDPDPSRPADPHVSGTGGSYSDRSMEGIRKGTLDVRLENTPDHGEFGIRIQSGVWAFLQIGSLDKADFAGLLLRAEAKIPLQAPKLIEKTSPSCSGKSLFVNRDIAFCARDMRLPARVTYAAIGDTAGHEPDLADAARAASLLTGVAIARIDKGTPDFLIVVAKEAVSEEALATLTKHAGVSRGDRVTLLFPVSTGSSQYSFLSGQVAGVFIVGSQSSDRDHFTDSFRNAFFGLFSVAKVAYFPPKVCR